MKREWLSPEEKTEYDALLAEAGFDDNDQRRPSGEIGERMHDLLMRAEAAGREWAGWVLNDDAEDGHRERFKKWDKRRNRQYVAHQGKIVHKTAVYGHKSRAHDGSVVDQQGLLEFMTFDEIRSALSGAVARRQAEDVNIAEQRKLLDLERRVPTATTPHEACTTLGTTVTDYLASDEAV